MFVCHYWQWPILINCVMWLFVCSKMADETNLSLTFYIGAKWRHKSACAFSRSESSLSARWHFASLTIQNDPSIYFDQISPMCRFPKIRIEVLRLIYHMACACSTDPERFSNIFGLCYLSALINWWMSEPLHRPSATLSGLRARLDVRTIITHRIGM